MASAQTMTPARRRTPIANAVGRGGFAVRWSRGFCAWLADGNSLSSTLTATTVLGAAAMLLLLLLAGGCAKRREVVQVNAPLLSPYSQPQVWAVAPLANESGVSVADDLAIADTLADEVQKIEDIDALPVQRVLDGMRAMDIGAIASPQEARALARLIGADAIVVGTITTYDPYRPPKLGLILQLYLADETTDAAVATATDLNRLRTAASDVTLAVEAAAPDGAPSTAAGIFDAADNGVRLDVEAFARGRTQSVTAMGWERYLAVMDLYTQYVSHRLLKQLLVAERSRLGGSAMEDAKGQR